MEAIEIQHVTDAVRVNSKGDPCPAWCQIDHSREGHNACVGSGGSIGHVWTRAVLGHARDYVAFSGSLDDPGTHWPTLKMDPAEAEDMATLVGLLAEATPEQHRKLAAAIRQAAAAITEAGRG